jgi:16S rRNA (guanine527-N7)-methyltransferase
MIEGADSQATSLVGALDRSRELGFLGPGPVLDQLEHSRAFAELLGPFSGNFLDLGAGGGLPGLVLLATWPQATAVLVDAQEKRCTFLRAVIADLGWTERSEVRCGRAEVLARDPMLRARFALVVARGFGPPAATAECAVGFLAPGGVLAVTEPPDHDEQTGSAPGKPERWPAAGLAGLGMSPAEILRSERAGAARMVRTGELDDRWPRRDGVPGKRPLW